MADISRIHQHQLLLKLARVFFCSEMILSKNIVLLWFICEPLGRPLAGHLGKLQNKLAMTAMSPPSALVYELALLLEHQTYTKYSLLTTKLTSKVLEKFFQITRWKRIICVCVYFSSLIVFGHKDPIHWKIWRIERPRNSPRAPPVSAKNAVNGYALVSSCRTFIFSDNWSSAAANFILNTDLSERQ